MIYLKGVYAILIILSLYSCVSQEDKELNLQAEKELNLFMNSNKSDTIIKDIPKGMQKPTWVAMKNDIEKKAGISSIENGFKDLQIRIWSSVISDALEQLTILTYNNSKWTAELYNLKFRYNDSLISINKKGGKKEPRSSWANVINNLVKLKILDLPDYRTFPGYYVSADADGVTIEISTKNKYRIYSYPNINMYKGKIPEVKKIDEILRFLQNEFDFELIK